MPLPSGGRSIQHLPPVLILVHQPRVADDDEKLLRPADGDVRVALGREERAGPPFFPSERITSLHSRNDDDFALASLELLHASYLEVGRDVLKSFPELLGLFAVRGDHADFRGTDTLGDEQIDVAKRKVINGKVTLLFNI